MEDKNKRFKLNIHVNKETLKYETNNLKEIIEIMLLSETLIEVLKDYNIKGEKKNGKK